MMTNDNDNTITWVCPRTTLIKEGDIEYTKRCNHIWSILVFDGKLHFSNNPAERTVGHCYCGQKLLDNYVVNLDGNKGRSRRKYDYFTIYNEYYCFENNPRGAKYWDY